MVRRYAALAALVVVAGCGGGHATASGGRAGPAHPSSGATPVAAGLPAEVAAEVPAVGAFTAGPCRQFAADLVQVATAARVGATAPHEPKRIEPALTHAQVGIRNLLPAAGAYRTALQRVSTAIGYFRLQTDTGLYTPALLTEVRASSDALVTRCTAGG